MSDFPHEKHSGRRQSSSSKRYWSFELEDVTTGSSEQSRAFSMRGEPDPVSNARKIIEEIENSAVAQQLEGLLLTIRGMIEIAKRERPDVAEIPPLHSYIDEDGSALVEWIFPDFRIGFNIESNPDNSGWHLVSNKKLGDITASGQLANMEEITILLLDFILSNV